jgi:hypothetical protein
MPTFTAIAFDRLIEPGASKSVDKSVPNSKPPNSRPIPNSMLERRNSTSAAEKRVKRPQMTPALYATPKVTPLPDSPTSFPPSPYIINHKRRGPRLMKSFSEDDVSSRQKTVEKVNGNMDNAETEVVHSTDDASVTFSVPGPNEEHVNGGHECEVGSCNSEPGCSNGELGSSNGELGSSNVELGSSSKSNGAAREEDSLKLERDGDSEYFFDPQDSLSITSNTDGEDSSGPERSMKLATPMGEFFDAWEGNGVFLVFFFFYYEFTHLYLFWVQGIRELSDVLLFCIHV